MSNIIYFRTLFNTLKCDLGGFCHSTLKHFQKPLALNRYVFV